MSHQSKSHKAIAVSSPASGNVSVIDLPTAVPALGEVLVKNKYASMIAFDTYQTDLGYAINEGDYPMVLGFNGVGEVAKIGEGVQNLSVGDKVMSFNYTGVPAKAMQEYSLLSQTVVAKLPPNISLPSAATIPDNVITAYFTLFGSPNLALPLPSKDASITNETKKPILIWGGGSTSAQYMIQLLKWAGYAKVLVTASKKHHAYLKELGASHVFDYSIPEEELVSQIRGAVGNVERAVDPIGVGSSLRVISKILDKENGKLAVLMPFKSGTEKLRGGTGASMTMEVTPEVKGIFSHTNIQLLLVKTFLYQADPHLATTLMPETIPSLVESGVITPNNVKLLSSKEGEGKGKTWLQRVEIGLDMLRNNTVSGEKIVVEIGDTV